MSGVHGFALLIRSEWTKLRTVRGWVVGLGAAALVTVLLGLLTTQGSHSSCDGGNGPAGGLQAETGSGTGGGSGAPQCSSPVGPNGEDVNDTFYFVHQPLAGDGSITVRVTSLTGEAHSGEPGDPPKKGIEPWAKAGLIVKDGTAQGSTYAAVMATGTHGVRLQYDFIHDVAGTGGAVSSASPSWLRLTRAADTITAYESGDGDAWAEVGSARLAGLPSTVEVGLFAASPAHTEVDRQPFRLAERGGPSQATATFDHLALNGWGSATRTADAWDGQQVGTDPVPAKLGSFDWDSTTDTYTVRGSGDIAPATFGPERTIGGLLVGAFAGLIAVVVVGALFVTAEYRRGLMSTTLTATPSRGRVLAAKVFVLGAVTFVVGIVAAVAAIYLGGAVARSNGQPVVSASPVTEVRVVVGTAALLAAAAVLALGIGTVLRRSAGAVAAVITVIVLPYILATGSVLPDRAADWLLRISPAAAFSIQQTLIKYRQVDAVYTPATGYFPLGPWTGFAVLCSYMLLALAAAAVVLRQRDA